MSTTRMRSSLLALMFSLSAASVFARGATPKELVVDLKFKPQEGVHESSANLPPSMLEKSVEVRVEDKRGGSDPAVIGQGTGGDDRSFPIKSSTDVKAYFRDTVESVTKDWGLKSGKDRVLVLEVTKFSIDESNKALGSVYSSEVKVGYILKTSGGKVLTEGAQTGSAHRYGRAHSEDNINEVLSDALKEAYANVLNDSKLQDAWTGKR